MNKTLIFHENSHIDLNASFAPGTYIELQLEKESDKTLNWSYVECNSEKKMRSLLDVDCRSIEAKDLKFIASFKGNICGFHLPISRDNEPIKDIKDIKDYKYYIIVFAYDEKKAIPSLEDFHIVIDMSFRVGVGDDEDVEESKLRNDFNSDIIQTNCIFSVFEAVEFLKACQSFKEKAKETNNYEFFKNYPQLAGKIAYIYYRFDLANEKFIKSVSDGDKYLKEREKFVKKFIDVYSDEKFFIIPSYKAKFSEFSNKSDEEKIMFFQEFLEDLVKAFDIEPPIPTIYKEFKQYNNGSYNSVGKKALYLNLKNKKEQILSTFFHEFRHFYIDKNNSKEIKNQHTESIFKLIYSNGYFKFENVVMFWAYDKKCIISNNYTDCVGVKPYKYSIFSDKPAIYWFSPSERDARISTFYFEKYRG
ncbi:hypothetical protein CV423_08315 [Campylobacter jejuni subsp. jejuni]|uniref:hypothetical protein n=1 Tax=Campylobacter jejuni TaxID=197 RepID=UPI000C2913EC|nr:hypothetical protein [Campylobacter jejuni]PJQ82897.1 hypothetical protein CV423_08315 [Campylobacter jejuni subsp. jejuni]